MYKETSRNQRGELANRSRELKNEDKIASCYDLVQDKKRQNIVTYRPHSAQYPDILRQTIENYTNKVS